MYMQFPEMPMDLLDLEVIYSSRYIDLEVIGIKTLLYYRRREEATCRVFKATWPPSIKQRKEHRLQYPSFLSPPTLC